MIIKGNKKTVARILRSDATIAHQLAFDVTYSTLRQIAFVAHWNATNPAGNGVEWAAEGVRRVFANLNAAEWAGKCAEDAVWRVYDEDRDYSHIEPGERSRIVLGSMRPFAICDICYSAALVAASILGMVEPEDDYAAIIEEWYRVIVTEEWERPLLDPIWQINPDGSAAADITGQILRPRSVRAFMVENEAQWPGDTPFRRRLNKIKARRG